jgi:hypothetical protein
MRSVNGSISTAGATMDVHWMMFAEGAEVVNNRLYMLGGGWDTIQVNGSLPQLRPVALAVTFRVPWDEAKALHTFIVELRYPSEEVVRIVEGQIEPGKPALKPLLPHANAHMAVSAILELKALGEYQVVVISDGKEVSSLPLRVIAGPYYTEAPS